jgi:4-amino-4-deoxy-L-arabinose transferase-like glycosyltransferase
VRTILVIIVLSIAFVIRLSVAASDIPLLGDAKTRYDPIANNLLHGNGFSRDTAPPYRADNFDQPGYPLLLASIYAVTNGSRRAVVLFQILLELLVLLPVVGIARELKLRGAVQVLAVGIGLICPFLAKYAGLVLSEVAATLVITTACYAFIRAINESSRKHICWMLAGLLSGISLLIRADTIIVVGLMSVVAIALAGISPVKWRLKQITIFVITLLLTLAPWTVRNYLRFQTFKPLGVVADQSGHPYVRWMNTWFDNPGDLKTYWWEALKEGAPPTFPTDKIPDDEERSRATSALLQARSQKTMMGEPARQFQELAAKAIQKRPLQTFVALPVKRVINTWLSPHINRVPTLMGTRLPFFSLQGLWLLLSGFALVGFLYALRLKRYSVLLLVAVIVGRTMLPLISSLGTDPRLLIEILPALYMLSALGIYSVGESLSYRSPLIRKLVSNRS